MKRSLQYRIYSLLISCILLLAGLSASANHIVGMDLRYQWVTGNTYRITLVAYGDCGVTSPPLSTASPRICIYNGNTFVTNISLTIEPPSAGVDITPVCVRDTDSTTCTNLSYPVPGIRRYTYSGTYTVPTTSHFWRFIFMGGMGSGNLAGRSASIDNITGGVSVIQLVDTLDNFYANNNSPNLTVIPTPYFCLNTDDTYNPGAIDGDGDSLIFSLVAGKIGNTSATSCTQSSAVETYSPGHSGAYPLRVQAGTFNFNQFTGQVDFYPDSTQRSLVVYNIREYRNDTFIGTSMREMNFLIQTCAVPPPSGSMSGASAGTFIDSTHFQICRDAGPFTFNIVPTAPDTNFVIYVSSSNIPAGATFTTVNDSTNHPVCTFSWNSTGVTPGSYIFYVTYRDNQCRIAGTKTIAYTVDINPLPSEIAGPSSVCVGQTIALSDTVAGGTWSTTDGSIATIGTFSGTLLGLSAGTARITYTIGAGCIKTKTITVNRLPGAILGTPIVCVGNTTTLSDTTAGGVWSSLSTGVATIGTTSGVLSGVGSGTSVLSYTLPTGCAARVTATVNALPAAISGTTVICENSSTILSNTSPGGTWLSSAGTVATVSPIGVVTGLSVGSATITYRFTSNGCQSTAVVTVNQTPAAISGPSLVCVGSTISLSNATAGGTWASTNTGVASIGATTGAISGLSAGTSTVSYALGNGCSSAITFSVTPVPSAISGSLSACTGFTTTLSNASSGGVWTSSNTTVATAGSSSGVYTGLSAGTSSITYTLSPGCFATATLTVQVSPASINGNTSLCVGNTSSLSDATPSGVWGSSNVSVATIGGTTGVLQGVSPGTSVITYALVSGCYAIATATINAAPSVITGSTTVCEGNTTSLSNSSVGGVWSSSATSIASVGASTGVVSGNSAGTATITYSIGVGCSVSANVTVVTTPAAISPSGVVALCVGQSSTLSTISSGGTWSSSATSRATVGATTGIVSGVSTGTSTISYTNAGGCAATKVVTVLLTPASISPSAAAVCAGSSVTLSNTITGGVWSSASPSVATVVGGITGGVAAGTSTISYTIGSCAATATVSVNAIPSAINPTGAIGICAGGITSLSNATAGGAWSSSSTGVATVNSTGVATGVSTGVVNISYSVSGCPAIKTITVNITPTAIAPSSASVCIGLTTTLSNTVGGGTWASSNTAVATMGATGIATSVTPGTTTITYTIGACTATRTLTVLPLPNPGTISGATSVCSGTTLTLSSSGTGGTWSSSNTSIATVGASTGIVTGALGGTATISYTVSGGCGSSSAIRTITVVPTGVAAISGPSTMCAGTVITLTNATPGGTWASSNTSGSITSGGLLTGISMGLDTIRYTVTNICGTSSTTKTVSIGAFLTAGTLAGATTVCEGVSITLSSTASGGTWSTANSTATVSSTGVVGGASAGTNTISYTTTASCGTAVATRTITVNPAPNAGTITGATLICAGAITTYSTTGTGGVWSLSNTNASISGGGLLTGITPGTTVVRYTVTNSCGSALATHTLTIGTFISPGTLSGASTVCAGSTITLSSTVSGGTWSARNATATISTGGIVTGVSAGVDTISYTVTSSCGSVSATRTITINPLPAAGIVSGPSSVCIGSVATYTTTGTGGNWSSSNATATISSGGVLNPVSAGTDTVLYTVTNICGTSVSSQSVAIGAAPVAGTLAGATNVCIGTPVTLSSTASGGVWSSTGSSTTVSTSGVVTGTTPGFDTISYTVTNFCGSAVATHTLTVTPLPVAGTVTGPSTVCMGTTGTFSVTVTGGLWSTSSTGSVASISTSGLLSAVSTGSDAVLYSVTNACGTAVSSATVGILPAPNAGTISGASLVCMGSPVSLSNTATGGAWSTTGTVATVSGGGVVTGISAGTTTITYTATNSCGTATSTFTLAVSTMPNAGSMSGPSTLCTGTAFTYTVTGTGGAWSSSNTSSATVTSAGLVTPVGVGSTTISYTATNACGTSVASIAVTIGAAPSTGTIAGATSVCPGAPVTLTNSVSGGVWSATNARATVSSGGVVTAATPGLDTIVYTITSGCGIATTTHTIMVNAIPNAGTIAGPTSLCAGSFTIYTDTVSGGAWSTSSSSLATITSVGVLNAVSPGVVVVAYTVSNSCGSAVATRTVTIGASLTAGTISGPSTVCTGTPVTLSSTVGGGNWSNRTGLATVTSGGIVSGVVPGVDTIVYTVTSSCGTATAAHVITTVLSPNAGTVSGPSSLCAGSFTIYTDTVVGGVWSSSSPSVATITSVGVLNAISSGVTVVSYTVTNACGSVSATRIVTVTPSLSAGIITGPTTVCTAAPATLSNAITGGVWSVTNSVATISSTGVVTGLAAGVDTVVYTVSGSCGTAVTTHVITVNLSPNAGSIAGPNSLCAGTFTIYTNPAPGGSWSTASGGVLSSITLSGVLTGIASGAETISYSVSNSCGTAVATKTITVGPLLSAGTITGPASVCTGTTISLTSSVAGGNWSSSNTNVAVSTTGAVTGVTAGSSTVTYTVTSGCGTATATTTILVNLSTSAGTITGPSVVCQSSLIILSNAVAGGVWGALNGNATITAGGVLTGVTPGVDTITYIVTGICGTVAATKAVTVLALPVAGSISGPSSFCMATTVPYTVTTPGGIWSSSNPSVASVAAGTGFVSGVSGGSATLSYTLSTSCGTSLAVLPIVVNPLPDTGTITGPTSVCVGATATLTNAAAGGVWTSSNSGVAIISSSGVIAGVAVGTSMISYSVTNGCGTLSARRRISVTTLPLVLGISGGTSVCEGATLTLFNVVGGGIWSTSDPAIATAHPGNGTIRGVSGGSILVSYSVTNSCGTTTVTYPVTVNPRPFAGTISGADSVCVGSTITLSNVATTGTWVTLSTHAAVSSFGIVSGISAGTALITYADNNICGSAMTTKMVTIVPIPDSGTITGSSAVCVGSLLTLSNAAPGGIWLASNANAMLVAPGVVRGDAAGLDTIFYVMSNICGTSVANKIISVNPVPVVDPISGPSTQCAGTTILLASTTSGGVWSSSNSSVATVGSASGIVTGVAPGIASIGYTVTNSFGCSTTVSALDTVTPSILLPGIMGDTGVCEGSLTVLTDSAAGGVWTSSNTAVATIGATDGVLTGIIPGTSLISYTLTTACGVATTTRVQTIHPLPVVPAITGTLQVCSAASTTLSNALTGGIWSSDDTTIAVVGAATGIVTGVAAGVANITYLYTSGLGCRSLASTSYTVHPLPVIAPISGVTRQCPGTSTTLANSTIGGRWVSADLTIATVGSATGIVSGVAAGITSIRYIVANTFGCVDSASIADTVFALPIPGTLSGASAVCVGANDTVFASVPGGLWMSGDISIAAIDAVSGIVTGVSAGTTTISHMVSSVAGCNAYAVTAFTVHALPVLAPITGVSHQCEGGTSTLANATAGGYWSSGSSAVATVGSVSGVVYGVAAGTTPIYYTYTNSLGCTASVAVTDTVHGLPVVAPITGITNQCVGVSTTLSCVSTGGTWVSADATVASVDAATGVVTGIAAGVTTISYRITSIYGCTTVVSVADTVIALPTLSGISGPTSVCNGGMVTLSEATTGGIWSSSNTAVATIGTGGIVTSTGAGSTMIYYAVSNLCGTVTDSVVFTVHPIPVAGPISGATINLCAGTTITLSSAIMGGAWSSSDTSIATVAAATGVVTGVSAGTMTVTYTVVSSHGCSGFATAGITVNPGLPASVITPSGSATLCNGEPVIMRITPSGGVTCQWYLGGSLIPGATNATYTTFTSGVYTAQITNGICAVMLAATNIVAPPNPVIVFVAPDTLATANTFVTYQWYINGVAIAGATSSRINKTSSGTYTVRVTDANGCAQLSGGYIVLAVTSIENQPEVTIYPNPATTVLNVAASEVVDISIASMDGKQLIANKQATKVNLTSLPSGMYMILIYNQQGQILKAARFTKAE